jgi:hypothetical protein
MKEQKWWVNLLILAGKLILKNQKGIKGTKNADVVDQAAEIFNK